jgi:ATP-dependent DNA ligase
MAESRVRPAQAQARFGRWGEGLTVDKMKECVWVRPKLAAEVEFVEWTPDGHLRHARFVGLKDSQSGVELL